MAKLSTYAPDTATALAAADLVAPIVTLSGTSLTISKLHTIFDAFDPKKLDLTVLALPDVNAIVGSFGAADLTLVTSLDLSALAVVTGSWEPTLTALTSLDLSSLVTVGRSFSGGMPSLTSLTLTSLTTVGQHFDSIITSLTSLSLPAIVTISGDFDIYSEQITTLTLNSGLKKIGGIFSLESVGKLNQASVDGALVRLAALDGTGGTTAFSNKAVTLSGGTNATPSATGLTAKATLEGRGCTVTVN